MHILLSDFTTTLSPGFPCVSAMCRVIKFITVLFWWIFLFNNCKMCLFNSTTTLDINIAALVFFCLVFVRVAFFHSLIFNYLASFSDWFKMQNEREGLGPVGCLIWTQPSDYISWVLIGLGCCPGIKPGSLEQGTLFGVYQQEAFSLGPEVFSDGIVSFCWKVGCFISLSEYFWISVLLRTLSSISS